MEIHIKKKQRGHLKMKSIINDKFYPCYINIENFKSTVALGWNGILLDTLPNKDDFFNHLKTVKSVSSLFSEEKLYEFSIKYFQYVAFIRTFYIWLNTETDREDDAVMWKVPDQWNEYVIELFEKYRSSQSLFEKILYDTILHDLLWNSKFDPNDPRIKEINMQRISNKVYSTQRDLTTLTEASSITKVLSDEEFIDDEKILVLDKIGYELIEKKYDADLNNIYFDSIKILELYKGNNIEVKRELCKLYFINELLESKYIFNNDLSIKDKENYALATALRSNILQDFKFYLNYILYTETGFNFDELYTYTPYYKVFKLERERIKNSREIINSLLNL